MKYRKIHSILFSLALALAMIPLSAFAAAEDVLAESMARASALFGSGESLARAKITGCTQQLAVEVRFSKNITIYNNQ